jgi:glutaredoxin 2
MSAMLRKRKQNQSIGICRDGPGFRVKPRARPWLRSTRARLGHLVVVDRRDGLSTSGGSGIEPGGGSICGNALKTRLPRRNGGRTRKRTTKAGIRKSPRPPCGSYTQMTHGTSRWSHLQETVVLEDDSETMIGLVGKRVVPILVKDDGLPMLESMDMVAHIDSIGAPVLTGPQRAEVSAWADSVINKTVPLTMPRYPLLGLPEFGTVAALDHYIVRKRKKLGGFTELRAKTREQIDTLVPDLETLDRLVESPTAVNGKLSLDDVRVLPLLRSAAVVKGLCFPQKVRDYFETMMNKIGYQPLPAV